MQKKYIAVAVAAVAVVGFAGVKQVGYQDQVKVGVENLVAQLDNAEIFGEEFNASLKSQEGGLMSSSGVIVLSDGNQRRPTEFKVEYEVNHGITTLLTGASYTATITNPVMDGDGEKTINSLMLGGKPIMLEGSIGANSIDGELTIPTIDFSENSIQFDAKPITAEFTASSFNDEGEPEDFELTASVPLFALKQGDAVAKVSGGAMTLTNTFDGTEGEGRATIKVAEASSEGGRDAFVMKSLSIETDSKVDEEFATTLAITFDSFQGDNGENFSDAELKYKLSGLDGKAFVEIIEVAQTGAKEGWGDRKIQEAMEGVLNDRADLLLAQNPSFELQSLKFKQDGNEIINASGIAKLDAKKLPENYLKDGLKSGRGPDPRALLQAAFVEFNAEFGKATKDLAMMFNPMAAAMLEQNGDKFTFKLEKGEMTMNGNKI